ncbi:MAG: hypothetical protein GY863_02175, partial [bacterium]|nr:hypothetical protein [bacterium]
MTDFFKYSILTFSAVFILVSASVNPVYSQTDHYTKGKEALDSGAWVKALNLWEYGKKSMEAEGQSDPRIG